jgi:prepilin-type N-terminal cleavage/methylation domain-containing protein
MHRQRGFTMIEVLVALLVLTIVITTSLACFLERNRRLQQANETILAYQVLANEAEVRRRIDYPQLDTASTTFITDTSLLAPLQPFQTVAAVTQSDPDVKNVALIIRWHKGERVARLALVRTNTGGNNLW